MKRRGLRVTLTAGAIGLAVVAGVVAFNWDVVRDHAEAWWFVATRQTETMFPYPSYAGEPLNLVPGEIEPVHILRFLADYTGVPVIIEKEGKIGAWRHRITISGPIPDVSGDVAIQILRANDWRLVEQRLPRRAYVVMDFPDAKLYRELEALADGLRLENEPPRD